jgi:hypothetical protein
MKGGLFDVYHYCQIPRINFQVQWVQSSRPIYNSSYSSPILNYNDKDFGFRYTEFQNLLFNPT